MKHDVYEPLNQVPTLKILTAHFCNCSVSPNDAASSLCLTGRRRGITALAEKVHEPIECLGNLRVALISVAVIDKINVGERRA